MTNRSDNSGVHYDQEIAQGEGIEARHYERGRLKGIEIAAKKAQKANWEVFYEREIPAYFMKLAKPGKDKDGRKIRILPAAVRGLRVALETKARKIFGEAAPRIRMSDVSQILAHENWNWTASGYTRLEPTVRFMIQDSTVTDLTTKKKVRLGDSVQTCVNRFGVPTTTMRLKTKSKTLAAKELTYPGVKLIFDSRNRLILFEAIA